MNTLINVFFLKARSVEKFESIVIGGKDDGTSIDSERLAYAKIEGPGATLAYMADDKTHVSFNLRCP